MFFTEEFEPRIDDYNANGNLSMEAMLKILENCGNHHSQSVLDTTTTNGVSWILAEWRLEVIRRPKISEKLTVTTWAHGKAPAMSTQREFVAEDGKGNTLFRASDKLALVDMKENKMLKITPEHLSLYRPEEKTAFDSLPSRLLEPESYDGQMPLLLRRSDIDFNGHVHNTRYLDFAMEAMTEDDYAADSFSQARIIYRAPIKPNDKPEIRTKRTETGSVFGIYAENRLCTLIEILY